MTTQVTTETQQQNKKPKKAKIGKGNPAVEQAFEGIGAAADNDPGTESNEDQIEASTEETPLETSNTTQEGSEPQDSPTVSKNLRQKLEPAQVPPPRPTKEERAEEKAKQREERQFTSPSAKRLGPLASKLPGAEHLELHKVLDNGQRGYVGMYSANDLTRSHSVEAFIHRYIKPSFGPGEYQITGVTADGRRIDGGTVMVLGPTDDQPPQATQQNAALELLQQMIQRDEQRRREEIESVRSQPHADPIEQMGKLHALSTKLTEGAEGDIKGAIPAMIQAMAAQSQASMQLMLQMMQKSDERMTTLLSTLGKKEMDPVLGLILTKLLDDKSSSGSLPPMAPTPSAVDPVENMKTMAEVVALLRPKDDGGGLTAKLLEVMLNRSESDRMSPRDVLELVNQVKGERGTDDFKKSLDNLGFMMNAVKTIRENTEGGGSSFWDALGALASNSGLGSVIAQRLRNPAAQQQPANFEGVPALESEAGNLERRRLDLERRRLALAERQIEDAERALDSGHVPHRPRLPMQPPPQQTVAPVPRPQPAVQAQPVQAPPSPPQQPQQMPEFPFDIADYVNPLLIAVDDPARIEALINLIFYLDTHESWRNVSRALLHFLSEGDQGKALKYVAAFLHGLQNIHLIDAPVVAATLKALESHFNEVVANIRNALAVAMSEAEETEPEPGEELDSGFEELVEGGDALGETFDEDEEEEEEDEDPE